MSIVTVAATAGKEILEFYITVGLVSKTAGTLT